MRCLSFIESISTHDACFRNSLRKQNEQTSDWMVHQRQAKLLRSSSVGRNILKPPRTNSEGEIPVRVDPVSYRHMLNDINSFKTMVLKLRRVLEESETLNPFDDNVKRGLYWNTAFSESLTEPSEDDDGDLAEENAKLRLQVGEMKSQLLLQQQLVEEKDRMVRHLQNQMSKYTSGIGTLGTANAATQTERTKSTSASLSRTGSVDSVGQLVSPSEAPSDPKAIRTSRRETTI